jgi:hypothetical protein
MKRGLGVVLVLGLAHLARGDEVGVGFYAPTAAFDGPVARLDWVSKLASVLGQAPDLAGATFAGKSFAKASDFTAAMKRGELQFAVVDAAYVAAEGSGWTPIATCQHGGDAAVTWQVVATGDAKSLLDLKGKTIAVPSLGSRDESFLTDVLLEGELDRGFFGKIVYAPDTVSALASVEHGRADAAVVPAGLAMPSGAHPIASLRAISLPVLVALPGAPKDLVDKVAAAAQGFGGADVLDRLGAPDGGALRGLAGSFSHRTHKGPMVAVALRLALDGLLTRASFKIAPTDPALYLH